MVHLTDAQEVYVRDVVTGVPFLSFNNSNGTFYVNNSADPTQENLNLMSKPIRKLRFNLPPSPRLLCAVRLDEIVTGYYDRCLEHYCYERLNLMIPHEKTCWVRFAEKTYVLGRIDSDTQLNDRAKTRFMRSLGIERRYDFTAMSVYRAFRKNPDLRHALKIDKEGWVMLCGDIPVRALGRKVRIVEPVKAIIKKAIHYQADDRIIDIVQSIRSCGWDKNLAWQIGWDRDPADKVNGAVLGYCRSNKRYFCHTGRHRIAAARYLFSQGELNGSEIIEFPIITYPKSSWVPRRPHPDSPVCDWCK